MSSVLMLLPPALDYVNLAYFEKHACIAPEHESAVKRAIWNLTLGLAQIRGEPESTLIFQVLSQSRKTKLKIWKYLDIAKPVDLKVSVVTPATSEEGTVCTVANMLAGKSVWWTQHIVANQVESVVLSVDARSRIVSFAVASLYSESMRQMRIEEVAADGTVGATLVAWCYLGVRSEDFKPSNYTPVTIAVETTATRFKISVRHTTDWCDVFTGLAVFRVTGTIMPLQ